MSDHPGASAQTLQDYLDGGLSSEERAAFEARLEREPALRREAESALELRSALGDEGPELGPGFYTRARARFEENNRAGKRWSFRLLSWETAGLLAAAAIATALFVPRLTQQGLPTDLGTVAQTKQQSENEKKRDSVADLPEPITQGTTGWGADAERDRLEEAAAPAKGERQAGREQDVGLSAAGSASGETRRAGITRDDDAYRATAPMEAEGEVAFADRGKRAVAKEMADEKRPIVVELPPGLVAQGELRSVERVDEWVTLLGSPQGASIEMLGAPAPERRLILIGAREGLACDSLIVTRDSSTHRIGFLHSPSGRDSDDGCALVLPRDGRNVTIDEPR